MNKMWLGRECGSKDVSVCALILEEKIEIQYFE